MAVVILGALPVIGTAWLPALHALAVSVLIVIRPPWSFAVVAGLLAATAPLAIALGDPEWAAYSAATVVWRGASVFVLVWLVGLTRRLQAARHALAELDPALLEDELQRLVEGSRRTLADGRRLIGGYQQPSLRAELDSATALLAAAGIQARVVLPAGTLPERVEAAPRAALRAAVARLLRDDAARHCTVMVTCEGRRVRLELRSDGAGPATTQVTIA